MKSKTEIFIEKATRIHGNKYSYSKIEYINSTTPVIITCRTHGDFSMTPKSHINTRSPSGCRTCALEELSNRYSGSLELFISRSIETHQGKYTYDKSVYVNTNTKLIVTCPTHGDFQVLPNHHYSRGVGCPACANEQKRLRNRNTKEDFISRSVAMHPGVNKTGQYTYTRVTYVNSSTPVEVVCSTHGSFFPTPINHAYNGTGCPTCANSGVSAGEKELASFVESLGLVQCKKKYEGLEFDIVIESLNIAIEYNGLYFHSEGRGRGLNYHLDKTKLAQKNGLRLIHVFEDEWIHRQDIVKSKLISILGMRTESRVYARKCIVSEITTYEAECFLKKYHIQGPAPASSNLGLMYDNTLVALATFSKARFKKSDCNELIRYATSTRVVGGLGKLLKHYFTTTGSRKLVSYSDVRWSMGGLYKALGFKVDSISQPGYFWCKSGHRYNRQRFQKHKLQALLPIFDEGLSESENCIRNGYYKVYDCGQIKWILEK
jgi:hypothetical protein